MKFQKQYKKLDRCVKATEGSDINTLIPDHFFKRKSGKTVNLINLAKKHNGYYVGPNRYFNKIVKRIDPNVKAYSIRQILCKDGLLKEGDILFVDGVSEKDIEMLKQFKRVRLIGFVKVDFTYCKQSPYILQKMEEK
ncbi:hypothetical protein [Staphylococcus gallinarum]|uniref:hypothetical protein n=1 Tax=Staphylococcus gallinarum TaxID=1293 RepID=UPI00244365E6|nr:hypothetical protein [Staphylococcus gallinarum]